MKKSIITTAVGLALLLTSCGDTFKGGWNINSTEGLTELNKEFAPGFGEKEFYKFEIKAKDNLTSEFGSAKISYLEEGVDYSQEYALDSKGEKKLEDPSPASDAFQTKFFMKNKKGKMKLADIDFSQIEKTF